MKSGEVSRWHKVDAAEVWHFYAGPPLQISVSADGSEASVYCLGPDLVGGERPQFVVPALHWQSTEALGAWTLAGCSVAPGFEFSGFELAPSNWSPRPAGPKITRGELRFHSFEANPSTLPRLSQSFVRNADYADPHQPGQINF